MINLVFGHDLGPALLEHVLGAPTLALIGFLRPVAVDIKRLLEADVLLRLLDCL